MDTPGNSHVTHPRKFTYVAIHDECVYVNGSRCRRADRVLVSEQHQGELGGCSLLYLAHYSLGYVPDPIQEVLGVV